MVYSKTTIAQFWRRFLVLLGTLILCVGCSTIPSTSSNPWEVITLPTQANMLDLAFTGNSQHGWLVGSEATLFETKDGGNTWQKFGLDLDDPRYRLSSVSFSGKEGWIAGQPSLLLHTEDEGRSWTRLALSDKLPGSPTLIAAVGPQAAELTTDVGAIYQTTDGGKTWKALVQDAFGVVRNITRSPDGKYIAVSSQGSFYGTWEPGQSNWVPYNRNSSRRLQTMGFGADGRLWMLERGGQVQLSNPDHPGEWDKPFKPDRAASWGLLDLAYRTPNEIWVAGGSGNLLSSFDGGKTWQKDRDVENVPANLYRILFMSPDQGFIIGQNGVLLKYRGSAQAA